MRRITVLALLLLVSCAPVLRAQSTSASLSGRITDPSKASIADARITAIRTDTDLRYQATTNSAGEYYLTNLPPNLYRIEVEKAGFKKLITLVFAGLNRMLIRRELSRTESADWLYELAAQNNCDSPFRETLDRHLY